jgi:PAS domain S-box-containing protein
MDSNKPTIDLETLVNALPCIVTLIDKDFNVLQQFNSEDTSIETSRKDKFLHGKVANTEVITHHLQQAKNSNGKYQFETQLQVSGDDPLWYEHIVNYLHVDQQYVIVSQDITDRKQQEIELETIRRRYDAIFHNMSDAIAINSYSDGYDDSTLIAVNDKFVEFFGYSFEELLKISPSDLLAEEEKPRAYQRHRRSLNGTNEEFVNIKGVRKDGEIVYLERLGIDVKDDDGRRLECISISRDITQQKQAEEELVNIKRRYDAILNNSNDAIFVSMWVSNYDDTQLLEINSRTTEMLGYSFDELRQMKASDFMLPEERDVAISYRQEIVQNRDAMRLREICVQHKSGEIITIESLSVAIEDDDGNIVETIAIARDITARKKEQQELINAKIAAETALRSQEIFIANMSHELRNPIHIIQGYTELLMNSYHLPDIVMKSLHSIDYSATHLTQLINDILDLSLSNLDNKPSIPRTFNLKQLLDRLHGAVNVRATQKNLKLFVDVATDVPQIIRLDEVKFKQILINLIDNAIKYVPEGSIHVLVMMSVEQRIRIEIADTGRGISPETLENIFQPFSRGKENEGIPGIGLGLLISKRLVETMGGTIAIQSELGQGTTVIVNIPFEAVDIQTAIEPVGDIHLGIEVEGEKSILIISNQPDNQHLIQSITQRYDFATDISPITDSISHIEATLPDLVILELWLNQDDVFKLIQQIRMLEKENQIPHITILVITSDTQATNHQRLLDLGCDDVLFKPFRFATLLERLSHLLNLPLQTTDILLIQDSIKVPDVLTSDVLAVLSKEWLVDMYHICIAGRYKEGLAHIEHIKEDYPELSNYLHELLEQYRTSDVADLIEPLIE